MFHDRKESSIEEFVAKSKEILRSDLEQIGLVIYSDRATLRPNPVLFYGINPGQDPAIRHHTHWTIEKSLNEFAGGHPSLITHQAWPKRKIVNFAYKSDHEVGKSPYQQRTQHLLNRIGHPNALVTNLVFHQSKNVQDLKKQEAPKDLLDCCWRVHELILGICCPDVIVTCPTVVDMRLGEEFGLVSPRERFPAKHLLREGKSKDWECKVWEGRWRKRKLTILAVPHMSVYAIANPARKGVLDRLKSIVETQTRNRPI